MRGPHKGFFGRRHREGRHSHFHHESFPEGKMGRILGHGDLRYIILYLLKTQKARHGYEIIKALEELSHGAYSPSPGSIYPTLTFLEESGLAVANSDCSKKEYAITPEGEAFLKEHEEHIEFLLQRMSERSQKIAKFKEWMGKADAEEMMKFEKSPLRASMHTLRSELFRFMKSNDDIKKQVAELIDKTVSELKKINEK